MLDIVLHICTEFNYNRTSSNIEIVYCSKFVSTNSAGRCFCLSDSTQIPFDHINSILRFRGRRGQRTSSTAPNVKEKTN